MVKCRRAIDNRARKKRVTFRYTGVLRVGWKKLSGYFTPKC